MIAVHLIRPRKKGVTPKEWPKFEGHLRPLFDEVGRAQIGEEVAHEHRIAILLLLQLLNGG